MATITTEDLWMIHGVSMGIAWGILVPLAIGSVFLRNHITLLKSNARWLRAHICLAILVVILTGMGYAVALMAEERDDDGRFAENEKFDDDVHSVVGIGVLGIVVLQVIAGFFRPKPVVAPVSKRTGENDDSIFEDEEKHGEGSNELEPDGEYDGDGEYIGDNGSVVTVKKPNRCTGVRKLWEWTHRLFGVLLLGFAWFNCHSGIYLFAEYYGPIDNLLKLFWGVTGSLSGIILVAGCVMRMVL
mmetsp:Transcript_12730/g.26308  ORF Transcript_12730/g.26308 Transcript_12730/m.26308 type:complete len:244 (-) Transcript_12730:567-1298(-)